jgi:flotillin
MSSVLIVAGLVMIYLIFGTIILNRIVKAGPNEVLVISGRKRTFRGPDGSMYVLGFRMLKGGRTFIWPFIERVDRLSLEVITHDMKTEHIFTSDAESYTVDGIAQFKIKGDAVGVAKAAEHLLTKTEIETGAIASNVVESHLRTVLAGMTSEQASHERGLWPDAVRKASVEDLDQMGIEMISLTVRDISKT